ncbi:microfibril-associated glycoprotein 4-like isoform X2 [Parambassis ranga]|uniref:Microfibril-associated glycoprotein 4-like isoform X2 n=1 Tax=Parambassis ranga TaxID=210632 RepID=A0A6P7KB82_9TELE|nr:microfibril-associated glycoprotein 4-like isoform X2 [Parambassis ranga]
MKLLFVFILIMAPLMSSCNKLDQPLDCSNIYEQEKSKPSGVYTIYPMGDRSAVQVYCDMDTKGGRWTVIQRRMDGSVNFYRPWNVYKMGFGSAAGEYWLDKDKYELLVDMEDFEGKKVFARYSSFKVGAECDGYILQVSGFTDGGAGDSLASHNGQKFSTFDKDQDLWPDNCARKYVGAFWYNTCHHANPNGIYRWGADNSLFAVGVEWFYWKGNDYSLKTISMKIRPVQ